MKRAVRISITFLLFIFIFPVSVFAEEKEEHYTKEQMESIVRNYENNEEMLDVYKRQMWFRTKRKHADETSRLWNVPERDAFAGSILSGSS